MKVLAWIVCTLLFSLVTYTQIPIVLGNPSDAVTDESQPDNYLVYHNGYILSYNHSRNAPNWVAWHLSGGDIGPVKRTDAFGPDTKLPSDWQINGDTFGSTYDRGH